MTKQEILMLQKAAKEGNSLVLGMWASQVESEIKSELVKQLNEVYKDQLSQDLDNWCTAIAYTLRFSEEFHCSKSKLPRFMEDLFVTVDMFRTGEYKPEDYREELAKTGVLIENYKYKPRKYNVVLIAGNIDLVNISKIEKDFIDKGYNVIYQSNFINQDDNIINQDIEKVRLADTLFICNKDKQLSYKIQKYIDKAKELHKTILYLEE